MKASTMYGAELSQEPTKCHSTQFLSQGKFVLGVLRPQTIASNDEKPPFLQPPFKLFSFSQLVLKKSFIVSICQ